MTWDDAATRLGVRRCSGCSTGDHDRGWAKSGVVHWSDRRFTKMGLRRYLMLIASLRLIPVETEWQRLYAYNTWAQRAAHELHIRIPARYADNDRARVLWLLTKEKNTPPHVKRWARRKDHS